MDFIKLHFPINDPGIDNLEMSHCYAAVNGIVGAGGKVEYGLDFYMMVANESESNVLGVDCRWREDNGVYSATKPFWGSGVVG